MASQYDHIDTILFDLGGVLMNVHLERTVASFLENGIEDFAALYSKAKQDHLFDQFEIGAISPAGFRNEVRKRAGKNLSDEAIDNCWNAMLGELPNERIDMIEKLKKRYQVLLLSNTNAIHVATFTELVREQNGIEDFKGLFHGAYYSNEIGMRKPNADVFHHVLNKHDTAPETTLFIDDTPHHVQGAILAGLDGYFLDLEKEDIGAALRGLGLI